MQYPRIIVLIDRELDRLQARRQALLPLLKPSIKPTQKRSRPSVRIAKPASTVAAKETRAQPEEPASKAAPVRRKRLERIPEPKPLSGESAPTPAPAAAIAVAKGPLSGTVPLAPVVVSAQQVQQALAERRRMKPAKPIVSGPQVAGSLTAEHLAQRWLRTPHSSM